MVLSNSIMEPPLPNPIITASNKCDNVWYGFFRKLKSAIVWALDGKLNANSSNGPGGWDDLRAPATAINPAGIVSPPTYDTSSVGYSFSATQDQRIDVIFQLPHGWKRDSNIHPHIHVRPLANSNGNVVWQLHTSWSNNFGTQPEWTITNTNQIISNGAGNIILKESKFTLGNSVPPVNSVESSVVKYKLLRMGADGTDTYAGAILFDEFDCHYYNEKAGTDPEYPT